MNEVHYYSNYANSRDIDCFFKIGNTAYHFASNGQPIPDFITRGKNIAVQDLVYERIVNADGDVVLMKDTIRALIYREIEVDQIDGNVKFDKRDGIENMIEEFASSFVAMAQMGFVSMDLDKDGVFHVIASPHNQVLEEDIMNLLPTVDERTIRID